AAGTFVPVPDSPLPNTGSLNFTTPGNNAGGDQDWVLVLESPVAPSLSAITPSPIDLGAAPGSFTLTGGGFADSGFGLPVVNFVDSNGVLLGQVRATALTGGGTTLTVPFPTNQNSLSGVLPGLHPGTVTVSVYNQTRADNFSSPASISLTVSGCALCVTGITPNPVDLAAAPDNFTLTGGGFADVGFGLPVVYFTRSGVLPWPARRSSDLGGGTTLTVPFPTNQNSLSGTLPGLSPGTVTVSVYNQTRADNFSPPASVNLTVNEDRARSEERRVGKVGRAGAPENW